MNKILINIPGSEKGGGVLFHYLSLKKYLPSKQYYFNSMGNNHSKTINIISLPISIIRFTIKLFVLNPKTVVLNPSLYPGIFHRDSILLKISKLFGKRCIVFFHGWYEFYQKKISSRSFNFFYGSSDSIIVLASEYKKQILNWEYFKPIYVTTTKVDDKLISNFKIEDKLIKLNNILFLARLEEYKGIFIVIKAFQILKKNYPNIVLTIAGDGSAKNRVQQMIDEYQLNDVILLGQVSTDNLPSVYSKSDIYILPSYSEGLPASVLEAMAFGLPIIASNVGGLKDFFVEDKMGILINSFEPSEYSSAIEKFIKDEQFYKTVSYFNYKYANDNFLASKVAINLRKIIED